MNWIKTSFSDIATKVKQSEKLQYSFKNLTYIPALFAYGLSIIVLLKIAQVLL